MSTMAKNTFLYIFMDFFGMWRLLLSFYQLLDFRIDSFDDKRFERKLQQDECG